MKIPRYAILKIDALELIRMANRNHLANFSAKKSPRYLLDLSDSLILHSSTVVSQENLPDNALFNQILKVEEERGKPLSESSDDSILKSVLLVDFSGVFQSFHSLDSAEKAIEKIKKTPAPFSREDHLSRLLNPHLNDIPAEEELLQICFSKDKLFSFLPFDKSASMAKDCQITYIRSDLRNAVNERLTLGIQFNEQKLQLSKYYAYRGLYLSAGRGIDSTYFPMNQNTVIVIPDLMLQPKGNFVKATAEEHPLPLLLTSEAVPEKGQPHVFKEIRAEGPKINAFDGEGFISPDYASYLACELGFGTDNSTPPTSFQIRMPFIKGMLHRADFLSFLQKEAPDDPDPVVRDCFGIPRKLNSVKIILTTSMFKCFKWLKNDWASQGKRLGDTEDPMEFFFTQFNKYKHRLYICDTNVSLKSDGFEDFNYQFLDTLKLSPEEFSDLIRDHFENCWSSIRNTYHPAGPSENKLIAAAQKNRSFYDDKVMYEQIESNRRKQRLNCGQGILKTHGQHCRLSSDLVALLFYLKDLANSEKEGKDLAETYDLRSYASFLLDEKFFLPGSTDLSERRYYALLRNPHLSRNEELILRPHIPANRNDYYSSYFGELRGVLMLPADSFSAMILGGADFDGDYVKFYTDETVAEAIHRGAYTKKYQRRLPVVMIPNEDSPLASPNDTDFIFLIINTFSNFTGILSNLAVQFAEHEYNKDEAPHPSYCAITCAVTGLEIDSAKHGYHPVADIKFLQKKAAELRGDSRSFIELKNHLKTLKFYYSVKLGKKDSYELSAGKYLPKKNIKKPEKKNHYLLQLPYAFAQDSEKFADDLTEKQELVRRGIIDNIQVYGTPHMFLFESASERYGTSGLTDVGIVRTKELINAWKKINNDMTSYRRKRAALKNIPEYAILYTLLGAKYDSVNEGVPSRDGSVSVYSISEITELLITFIREALVKKGKGNKILDKALRDQWIFVPAEKRREALCQILGIDELKLRELPPAALDLICDFSCKGYLILEYALIIAKKLNKAEKDLKSFLKKIFKSSDENTNGFYAALKEYLFNKYRPADSASGSANSSSGNQADDESDGNSYFDEDSVDLSDSFDYSEPTANPEGSDVLLFTATPEGINNECYRLLETVIIPENKINASDNEEELILKYVWAATYGPKGSNQVGDLDFFWEILPKDLILSGIKEDKY